MKKQIVVLFALLAAALTSREWILKNPAEAQKIVQAELAEETKGKISAELIAQAWQRITLTTEVTRGELEKFVVNAKAAGFIKIAPDLSKLIEQP